MASQRSYRLLSRDVIKADRVTLRALRVIPEYKPFNQAYSTDTLVALEATLGAAEHEVVRAKAALEEARRRLAAAANAFHEGALGARLSIRAQFGDDSHEIRAVGLTRASDRKRPIRRPKAPAAKPPQTSSPSAHQDAGKG